MIIKNPVIKADMPDVDVLRVGDTFYMVSTTMFFMPGAVLLRSKDLCNWEIATYIFDKIADNDIYELKNGKHAYGVGQWATSLAYHNGRYYACFVCLIVLNYTNTVRVYKRNFLLLHNTNYVLIAC